MPLHFSTGVKMSITRSEIAQKYDKFAVVFTKIMLAFGALVFAVMIFSVTYGVIGRFAHFVRQPRWTQELAVLCLVWLCFASAGYGIYDNKHANMTVFVSLFPEKAQKAFKVLAYVLLLFVNIYWIYYGISLSSLTSMAKMSATGWPQSLTYISIVVGGIYGLFMTIGRFIKGGL